MTEISKAFLKRNIPQLADSFNIEITNELGSKFTVTAENGIVSITADNYVCAFHGFYEYLKKYCSVQLSWCGNRKITIKKLTMFSGEFTKSIEQKFRVYMNYCTLDYSMCWWNFERWEQEIDFMAMNGINMPLGVVGSEAVLFETLLQFGFSEREALDAISGPAFWAWQLMTNIEGYIPPPSKSYIEHRLALGKKIIERYAEFGMTPIQQGFSGHVPALMKEKFPKSKILMQRGWCGYPKTAQLDPLDPLFAEFGTKYLKNLERLFGNYHYIACDPFHEGTPPKKSKKYLNAVGKAINSLYESFDKNSVWVMQAWTMRKNIVLAVPKSRLLILDLNSEKTAANNNMWGYPVVCGMLHNFGGKNAMQGQLKRHCKNKYLQLKNAGANVAGSGMFMEGIEQNPVIYDLQFELLTSSEQIDIDEWICDYIKRRYGKFSPALKQAWDILLQTCYKENGYRENEIGSTVASRPQFLPVMTGPCCYSAVFYDTALFEKAAAIFLSQADEFKESDGYQYDLCDIVRQVLSNRFYTNQKEYAAKYKKRDLNAVRNIAALQLQTIRDLDFTASHRSEMCLSRWICDAQSLAENDEERKYFNLNARTLITLWGNINTTCYALYDYSWREWSGLINEYYYPRWQMFYSEAQKALESKKRFKIINGNSYILRKKYLSYPFGKKLGEFELEWVKEYKEYSPPADKDVIPAAKEICKKYNIT